MIKVSQLFLQTKTKKQNKKKKTKKQKKTKQQQQQQQQTLPPICFFVQRQKYNDLEIDKSGTSYMNMRIFHLETSIFWSQ